MKPVLLSNPPNPWSSTDVEYLEGTPEDVGSVSVGGTAVVVARGTLEVPG